MLVAFHSSISQATEDAALLVALSLADRGVRTLLLDLNIEPSAVTRLLENPFVGSSPRLCYGDVVRGNCSLADAVFRCKNSNLHALQGGYTIAEDRYDGLRRDRLTENKLVEQVTAIREQFDLTILALPDRFPTEVDLLLPITDGMVMMLEPSHKGRRGCDFYVQHRTHEPDFRLPTIIGGLIYGTIDKGSTDPEFFEQRLGALLLPSLSRLEWNEIAVYSGVSIERLSPTSRDAEQMTRVLHELMRRLIGRGLAVPSERYDGSLRSPLYSKAERQDARAAFFNDVEAFMAAAATSVRAGELSHE